MDLETNRADSSLRRHSFKFSNAVNPIYDDMRDVMESGIDLPIIPGDDLSTAPPVSPSTLEIISPLSTEAIIQCDDKKQVSSSITVLSSGLCKVVEEEFCMLL